MLPPAAIVVSPGNPLRRRGAVCLVCLDAMREKMERHKEKVAALRKHHRTFGGVRRVHQVPPVTVMMPRD